MEFYYPIPSIAIPTYLPQLSSLVARGLAPTLYSHEAESSPAGGISLPASLEVSA
jgi:hypothetical protein